MSTVVRLLGPPHVVRDGELLPGPRGRKPWAVLALVLAGTGPVPRCRARDLLFADAEDPQAALRWALSQARRATGDGVQLGGNPLRCQLVADTCVDVLDVLAGRAPRHWPAEEAGLPLLEGAEPDAAGFGTWLVGRRLALQHAAAELTRSHRGPVRELVQPGGDRLHDGRLVS